MRQIFSAAWEQINAGRRSLAERAKDRKFTFKISHVNIMRRLCARFSVLHFQAFSRNKSFKGKIVKLA